MHTKNKMAVGTSRPVHSEYFQEVLETEDFGSLKVCLSRQELSNELTTSSVRQF